VDAAASTEETVVEEVEPQTKEMKVLAGYFRVKDGAIDNVSSIIYDEFGNPVKLIFNDCSNEGLQSMFSDDLSADDFMSLGEKYVAEYAEVTKSENGMILEMDWYTADGTNENDHTVYTHNEFGSDLTEDNATCHIEYTYDESGKLIGEHGVYTDGTEYNITSDNITSEVDEDGIITFKSAAGPLATIEYYYYYTTIEVPVQ
jgi:YD repeat-containing protein